MPEHTPKRAITGFYMAHWGVPVQFHIQEPHPFELAVLEFGPGKQWGPMKRLQTARLATNGMCHYLQSDGQTDYRTELYLCARTTAPWMIEALTTLARYPLLHQTWFGECDTLPLTQPYNVGGCTYVALLLVPPEPEDPDTLGVIWNATPEPIHVHRVVAITQAEYEISLRFPNGRELWERLARLEGSLLVDEARPDAVGGFH